MSVPSFLLLNGRDFVKFYSNSSYLQMIVLNIYCSLLVSFMLDLGAYLYGVYRKAVGIRASCSARQQD